MPRIGTQLLKSVFYLFGHLQNQFINHNAPAGTGFFVGRHSTALPLTRHVYAVSNWHVVRDAPCVRVNLVGGGSRKLEIEHDEWVPLAGEDMAAADVTDHLRQSPDPLQGYDDISWLEEHSFVRQQGFRDAAVGDDTFMVGLFSDHRGDTENAPVGRFGNIASVPNAAMPVELHPKDPYPSPAYLNDMRSRTGFSGSP